MYDVNDMLGQGELDKGILQTVCSNLLCCISVIRSDILSLKKCNLRVRHLQVMFKSMYYILYEIF